MPVSSRGNFLEAHWIVSAAQAKQLIEWGATVLDTRSFLDRFVGHVPGAGGIRWQEFSQQKPPHKGKLLENHCALEEKLRSQGICNAKPVIVVGNPRSPFDFGESGRIVWMLRTLGHKLAAFVDGGHPALVETGIPCVWGRTQPKLGDFVIEKTDLWVEYGDRIKAKLEAGFQDLAVIDTRSAREYAGATPYGEQRGGHIPGALHFYFKDLLDSQGKLLPRTQILAQLKELGISRDTPTVAYCTGGVRSAFFVAVLTELGFTNVKNYAGSMWEWSGGSAAEFPLSG